MAGEIRGNFDKAQLDLLLAKGHITKSEYDAQVKLQTDLEAGKITQEQFDSQTDGNPIFNYTPLEGGYTQFSGSLNLRDNNPMSDRYLRIFDSVQNDPNVIQKGEFQTLPSRIGVHYTHDWQGYTSTNASPSASGHYVHYDAHHVDAGQARVDHAQGLRTTGISAGDGEMHYSGDPDEWYKDVIKLNPATERDASKILQMFGQKQGLSPQQALIFGDAAALLELAGNGRSLYMAQGAQTGGTQDALTNLRVKYKVNDDGLLGRHMTQAVEYNDLIKLMQKYGGNTNSPEFQAEMQRLGISQDAVTKLAGEQNLIEYDRNLAARFKDNPVNHYNSVNYETSGPTVSGPEGFMQQKQKAVKSVLDEKITSANPLLKPSDNYSARYNAAVSKFESIMNDAAAKGAWKNGDTVNWLDKKHGIPANTVDQLQKLLLNTPSFKAGLAPGTKANPNGREAVSLAKAEAMLHLNAFGNITLAQGGKMTGFTDNFIKEFGIDTSNPDNAKIIEELKAAEARYDSNSHNDGFYWGTENVDPSRTINAALADFEKRAQGADPKTRAMLDSIKAEYIAKQTAKAQALGITLNIDSKYLPKQQ